MCRSVCLRWKRHATTLWIVLDKNVFCRVLCAKEPFAKLPQAHIRTHRHTDLENWQRIQLWHFHAHTRTDTPTRTLSHTLTLSHTHSGLGSWQRGQTWLPHTRTHTTIHTSTLSHTHTRTDRPGELAKEDKHASVTHIHITMHMHALSHTHTHTHTHLGSKWQTWLPHKQIHIPIHIHALSLLHIHTHTQTLGVGKEDKLDILFLPALEKGCHIVVWERVHAPCRVGEVYTCI